MQKLTQFAGSSQILGGYGKNTDGHQALKGLRLWATALQLLLHAQRSSWKVLLVQRCRSVSHPAQVIQKNPGERSKTDSEPETRGLKDQRLAAALMFYPWVQHSAQMVTAQLLEKGSPESQAFWPKAMKMAFYDSSQPETSCSGVLKVKKGLSPSWYPGNTALFDCPLFDSLQVNKIRWLIIASPICRGKSETRCFHFYNPKAVARGALISSQVRHDQLTPAIRKHRFQRPLSAVGLANSLQMSLLMADWGGGKKKKRHAGH